jgi:hypothetical protein
VCTETKSVWSKNKIQQTDDVDVYFCTLMAGRIK